MSRLSPYLVKDDLPDGSVLATSLATGAVVQLSPREFTALQACEDPTGVFTDLGLLVDNDNATCEEVCRRHRYAVAHPAVLNLTILPTLACNLACPYCFESSPRPVRMRDSVADSIVELARRRAPGHLRLDVAWFGGEPLLEIKRIANLHPRLLTFAEQEGIEFTSSLTTNGTLLSKDSIRMIDELGIRNLQVTIDGDRDIHDSTRFTKKGFGTFDVIHSNLYQYLDDVENGQLVVRVNTTLATVGSTIPLLDRFHPIYRKRIFLHLHPIMGSSGPDAFSQKISDKFQDVYRHARKLGYGLAVDQYLDPSPAVYCYAERDTSLVIDPRGWLYKCAYAQFDESERIGVLRSDGGIVDETPIAEKWRKLSRAEPSECLKCSFLPICGFGCPRLRHRPRTDIGCRFRFRSLRDTLVAVNAASSIPVVPEQQ